MATPTDTVPAQPVPEPDDPEGAVVETVGDVSPWKTIDIALDGWEYHIWDKWLGNDAKKADLLLDVLHQYDPTATMTIEKSKSVPGSADDVVVFRFSLFGDPDGVSEAITAIQNQFFAAAENYKVYAGRAYVVVTYADGSDEIADIPTKEGTDIDDALRMSIDATYKQLGSKGEEEELFGRKPKEPWPYAHECPYGCGWKYTSETSPYDFQTHLIEAHPNEPATQEFLKKPKAKRPTEPDATQPVAQPTIPKGVAPSEPIPESTWGNVQEICENHGTDFASHTTEELDEDWTEGGFREEEEDYKPAWTPDYQAVPKAMMEAPDLASLEADILAYEEELSSLIDKVLDITARTPDPDAIKEVSDIAERRVKEIVKWATDASQDVMQKMEGIPVTDPETQDVLQALQDVIEHGTKIRMLLVEANVRADAS
jgi:hypothetical protein